MLFNAEHNMMNRSPEVMLQHQVIFKPNEGCTPIALFKTQFP